MLHEEVIKYRELSGDTNPHTPISRIGGYLDGYERALEQEPFKPMGEIDLDYVIKQKYIERDALDKIRAEIKSLSNANPSYWHSGDMVDRDDVLDIIDKYRAEREKV